MHGTILEIIVLEISKEIILVPDYPLIIKVYVTTDINITQICNFSVSYKHASGTIIS